MSRSSPLRSNTAPRPNQETNESVERDAHGSASHGGWSWHRRIVRTTRWLHVYLSMLGLAVIVFFSLTGITLNHPDWFGSAAAASRNGEGKVDIAWVDMDAPGVDSTSPEAGTLAVDKLAVVEHLRSTHGIRGAVSDFTIDDRECVVIFKGPGYSADAFIDRSTGEYTLTETMLGWVAVINDLHKGRDTGKIWSLVIDVSAFLTAIASITGFILLCYAHRRWSLGISTAIFGTAVAVFFFLFGVP